MALQQLEQGADLPTEPRVYALVRSGGRYRRKRDRLRRQWPRRCFGCGHDFTGHPVRCPSCGQRVREQGEWGPS